MTELLTLWGALGFQQEYIQDWGCRSERKLAGWIDLTLAVTY